MDRGIRTFTNVPDAAKFLDEVLPGWALKVTKPVNQKSGDTCVIGQNVGYRKYPDFIAKHDLAGGVNTGVGKQSVWVDPSYNAEWQFEVNARKNGVVPAAPAETPRVTILAGNSVYEVDRTFDGLMRLLSYLDVDCKEREITKL